MPSKSVEFRLHEAERELQALKLQAAALESRLDTLRRVVASEKAAGASMEAAPKAPPPLPEGPASPVPEAVELRPRPTATRPAAAPVAGEDLPSVSAPSPAPPVAAGEDLAPAPTPSTPFVPKEPAREVARDDAGREGLELRLGRVWFVRLGVGLVLTGLVFLSTYAYRNFIIHWDAGSRVAMMYFLAALLTGFGLILERSRASLRNYARVVTGGGFAALYYTTYAAHHVAALKVIDGPVLAAGLLTVCAAVFFTYAAWRKSSTLAISALILGFYGIALNPMGSLGCFAGLVLAAAGMFLFLRHNWMHIGFAALAGAYGAFAYWQGLVNSAPDDATRWFLAGYWLLFTAASLAPGARRLPDSALGVFVAINNVLPFLLFTLRLRDFTWHPELGACALTFGGVLLALAIFLKRFPTHPRVVRQVHLAQGLALVTWGISIELSGYHLFVSLAVEAALLALAWRRTGWAVCGVFAAAAAVLGALVAIHVKFVAGTPTPGLAWLVAGLVFAAAGWLARDPRREGPLPGGLSMAAFGFTALALLVPSVGLLTDLPAAAAGRWMLATGLLVGAATLLPGRRRVLPELGWLTQPYALAGGILALQGDAAVGPLLIATVLLFALAHLHGWLSGREAESGFRGLIRAFEFGAAGLFTVGAGLLLAEATATDAGLLAALAVLPLAFHIHGSLTRCAGLTWMPLLLYLPILGLTADLAIDGASFADHESLAVLLAVLGAASHFVVARGWMRIPPRPVLREGLFPLAAALWFAWVFAFVDHPQLLLALTGLGLLFVPSSWRVALHIPAYVLFLVAGLGIAALDPAEPWWACYLTVPVGFAAHYRLTRGNTHGSVTANRHELLAIPVAGALAVIVSRHTLDVFDGNGLSVAWALLAVCFFALGLGVRRRLYRWAGLVTLAATLAHVLSVEVWKLETLLRIVSFLTLGLVLLALGFVYNRWAERIKRLL